MKYGLTYALAVAIATVIAFVLVGLIASFMVSGWVLYTLDAPWWIWLCWCASIIFISVGNLVQKNQ